MKKILLALAIFASVQVANAQMADPSQEPVKKITPSMVQKAEAASMDAKKAVKADTWVKLGKTYVGAYDTPLGAAANLVGADPMIFKGAMTTSGEKPISEEAAEFAGAQYTKQVYKDKNLYLSPNGVLTIIEVTAPVVPDALQKALQAYKKAAELDSSMKKTKEINEGIDNIVKRYSVAALWDYYRCDSLAAEKGFESAYEASLTAPYSQVDTNSLFNAALISKELGNYSKSSDMFKKCLEYNYFGTDGSVYSFLAQCTSKMDTTAAGKELAKQYLEEGFSKFPTSSSILADLINAYSENKESFDRLFELIDKAKQIDPDNTMFVASLYGVEGNAYKELGQFDNALASYQESTKIYPKYLFGYYAEGNLYLAEYDKLNDPTALRTDEEWAAAEAQQKDLLLKSLAPFEKAYEVAEGEEKISMADQLKRIYFMLRDESQEYMDAYNKYNDIVNPKN